MDFKWRLSRPGIELEFETGSIGEAIGLLEQEGTQISEVFGFTMGANSGGGAQAAEPTGTVATGEEAAPKTRGRKPKVDAVAPAPLPVPGAASPAVTTLPPNALAPPAAPLTPEQLAENANGVPKFLERAAPPPPLLPSAPPIAPPPPPAPPVGGVLGAKVVAALEARKPFPDGGKALADWLAAYNLTVPGSTYDEACQVVLQLSDDKLAAAAGALGVA